MSQMQDREMVSKNRNNLQILNVNFYNTNGKSFF